jgi:hypothetical protein
MIPRKFLIVMGLGALTVSTALVPGCYFNKKSVADTTTDADRDGDGFDGGKGGDCDDSNSKIFPGAGEVCGDGKDNDCDGKIDSADPECKQMTTSSSSSAATTGSGGSVGSGSTTSGSGGAGGTAGSGGAGTGGTTGAGGQTSATTGSGGSGGATSSSSAGGA